MLISILSTISLSSLAISLIMFASQVLSVDFMNKDKRKEYLLISKKSKEIRSKEEQDIINKTWHKYYMTQIRIISFKVGIVLLPLAILLNYITNTRSQY